MASKDYYKTLGIEKNASPEDIKKAYRKLALQYHPDKNKGDKSAEEKFKAVNEANSVLIDPEKRKLFDKYGENWEQVQQGGPAGGGNGGAAGRQRSTRQQPPFSFDASDFENDERFEDLFSQFFGGTQGGRGRTSRPRNGADAEAEVQISLEDAFSGMTRMLSLGTEQYRLTLKKGVREGQQFRLRGKGQPGTNGGKTGDLLLNIRIAPHPRYTRTGNDLRCKQSVDLVTAVLGGKARVPTLHGEKVMTLQSGTQNGAVLRMRGLGMPVYDTLDKYGDLYVEIAVEIPRELSAKERELYEALMAVKSS
ncbi:MAG: J domain-containing protein [Saprospiraceae bacterium]|nr:J domain-containing protein [Saprospiraceae bacterium]